MNASLILTLGFLCTASLTAVAQDAAPSAVSAGKGAYAASIPANVALDGRTHVNKAAAFDDKPVFLLNDDGTRPIPSNHWDSSLFYQNFGVGLWSYPLEVSTGAQGFQVFYATKWNGEGRDMQTDQPLVVSGADFFRHRHERSRIGRTGWSPSASARARINTSTPPWAEGMPYVWLEYHGTTPTIQLDASAKFFDLQGASVSLPATSDALGIESGGRDYAVFARTARNSRPAPQASP